MTSSNFFNHMINGSARTALVILPALKGSMCLVSLANKTFNLGLKGFFHLLGYQEAKPGKADVPAADLSRMTKAYNFVHSYVPKGITDQKDAYKDLGIVDLAKGAAFYTATTMVSIFVLNKLLGPAPELYNSVAKYAGSPIRMDVNYDVIQLAINYVTKKA